MVSPKKWVVLFGGAGREACVTSLLSAGMSIQAIIVPSRRSGKLEKTLDKLKNLSSEIVEVERENMAKILRSFAGQALLSVGFPYLIASDLLELFKPALNVHPTLLPRYRGPTTAAYILINNERESGSTIHHLTPQMDRGDILAQSRVPLTAFDTIRSLQRKVYASEGQLVLDALAALNGGAQAWPQDETQASEFPKKRTPADSQIDPSRSLLELFNQIRACDPEEFPAFFIYHDQKVCIRLWRPEKLNTEDDEI